MRLIDADALIDALIEWKDEPDGTEETVHYNGGLSTAIMQAKIAPTVDAVPVEHGEWEVVAWVEPDYHSFGLIKKPNAAIRCKNCGHAFKKGLLWEANFCPNCGATMDGGAE